MIFIEKEKFEHLLNCMCNQKFVHEFNPKTRKELQDIIDKAYHEAMTLLHTKQDMGSVSDGYHTFDELYYHRMRLFAVICNTYKDKAWKSWKHADGSMYDDYFIVGVTTDEGDYSYHYHKDEWGMFNVKVLENAPEWDGHKPSDIGRLDNLLK